MDGRQFRKWCVFGCLFSAAVGCNKNSTQAPYGQMPNTAGQPTIGVPMPSNSKSMWGGKSNANAQIPVEFAPDTPKGPPSANTLSALADVRLEAAMSERTAPGSREGLLDAARKGYQKALEQEPKNKAALLGMARFYARIDEKAKAVEMYKKYLTLYPTDANVAHEVAMAHARWKDWTGAVAWCEFTLKIDPENRAVKNTMGFCLARAGKWEEGFAVLCKIMPEAQARYDMARVLEHLNMGDAGRVQLQMALKADPTFAPAREFLAEMDAIPPGGPGAQNPVRQASDVQPTP